MMLIASCAFSHAVGTLNVGIYQNEPKIFVDRNGTPTGFWVELLNHIAEKEDWIVRYVPGTWEENLQRLKNHEIDILPDVAYNFAFPRDNVHNQHLIDIIDTEISQLKTDETSFYYDLMEKWFNVDSGRAIIPQWLFWLLMLAILFAVMLGLGSHILRKQVKERTAALTEEIHER